MITPEEPPEGVVDFKYRTLSRGFDEAVRAYDAVDRKVQELSAKRDAARSNDFTPVYFASAGLGQEAPHLSDAASALGDLTGVDGAVVLGPRFGLLGFGALFRKVESSIPALLAEDPDATDRSQIDLSKFGSRHRSVATFCHEHPGAIGVVVSQDGEASCFLRPAGEETLLVWRPVPLEWSIPTIEPPTWSAAGASRGQVDAPRGWRAMARRIREGWKEQLHRSGAARRKR